MSRALLSVLVVIPTVAVLIALFYVMWSARSSARSGWVAIVSGVALAAWMTLTGALAYADAFVPRDASGPPPIGVHLALAFAVLAIGLAGSPTLRRLLTNQRHLIRLNVWRLIGALFLALMFTDQVPAAWALPAGLGDVIVGAAAFSVAARVGAPPRGTRLAVLFHVFGLADLIVAVGLGVMMSPGPTQLFHTTPTTTLMTQFPLALVPGFLVPLAMTVHVVSLLQFLGLPWVRPVVGTRGTPDSVPQPTRAGSLPASRPR